MTVELKQLLNLLKEYEITFNAIEDKYEDPEYLAWISVLGKEGWPKTGEFFIARKDLEFRKFRSVYMDMIKALETTGSNPVPYPKRHEYHLQYVKDYPEVVPF